MAWHLWEEPGMQINRDEYLHLLKCGRLDEARAMIEDEKRQNFSNEFCPFMAQMLKEHGVKRKDVAVRSGLSQDYVYKLLRGDKHTDERDYILAMCIAIGMSLGETQHALSCYGMPILSDQDRRSMIIKHAIMDGSNQDCLDEMLENAGFLPLKVTPDMKSAPITSTMPTHEEEHISHEQPVIKKRRQFEEIDSFTEGHHNGGNAPFDYDYQGWIKVKSDDGQIYQVEAVFATDYTSFIVFTEEQRKKAEQIMQLSQSQQLTTDNIPEVEMLESYDSLEEAAGSEFFSFFLEIDKRTDKEVLNVMRKLDDTREQGLRAGASFSGNELPKIYIEAFNTQEPERREYYQVVMYSDGTCHYTATHESIFMQIELGKDLYEAYFGSKRTPEYFVESDANDFSGKNVRYRFIFNGLKMALYEYNEEIGSFLKIDTVTATHEKVEYLIEQGIQCHLNGNEKGAIPFFKQVIYLLESNGTHDNEFLASYVHTCSKIAHAMQCLHDPEQAMWWGKIYALRDLIYKKADENPAAFESVVYCLADAVMTYYRRERQAQKTVAACQYVEEAIALLDRYPAGACDWQLQFEAHAGHAILLEDDNLDESLREYRLALKIARNHHLEQNPHCAHAVAVIYNNFAWVLWNKCSSEEAVLHYGRAIDLLESYLFTGIVSEKTVRSDLKDVGKSLNKIYLATNRIVESDQLKERLAENEITID